MICSNCKSNIPDDSKFCPECANPLDKIDELRKKIKEIVAKYGKGYDYYVNLGSIPEYSTRLSKKSCENIISKKELIIKKHRLLEKAEKDKVNKNKYDDIVYSKGTRNNTVCLNCNSNIPDDSMFCPDCGATVVGVEIIRSKTKDIISECKSGYVFFVKNGILPRLVYNSTVENCKKILSYKKEIEKKNKSLLDEEIENNNKRQEEIKRNEQIIREASKIALYYPNGYRYYKNVCHFENYTQNDFSLGNFLSLAVSMRVLAKKDDIIRKEREFQDEKRKTEEQRIRNNASEIIRSYPKGYRHYVDRGSLPTLNPYSSISDCRKIISYKESITLKHNQIVEEENEYILKRKANFIKEQCKPDNSTNIVWTIILIIVIYVWSCIEQPYEAFGKNLFAPVFGIFIYPILRVFFNNPETIQKKNIEEW